MTTKRKIIAWVVGVLLCAPGMLAFNDSYEHITTNFVGIIYIYLLITFAPRILPKWMIDDFATPTKLD